MDCRKSERTREYVFYFLSISDIQSCEIIEGDLHSRADRMVRECTNGTRQSYWICGSLSSSNNFLDGSKFAMATYPKVKSVSPLSAKQLFITFINRDTRIYDCAPLLNESCFCSLKEDAFF